MKCLYRSIVTAASLAALLMMTACDWSSGSQENFNLSGGSSNINVSGFYEGNTTGGRVVANTSNGNIVSIVIQQSGNRVEVTDNQGSTYSGSLGSPLNTLSGGTATSGTVVSSFQISFSGKDGVAAKDINFTGVLTIVAVSDIDAVTSTNTNDNGGSSTTTTNTNSVIEPTEPDDEGSGTITDSTSTATNTTTDSTTSTSTYSLTGPTTQLRLQGTWVEVGGVVSNVSAIGPPAVGNISILIN